MNNVGKVRQQCWMISRPLDLPPPPAPALNAAAPIWIYHYWQLESINPLIYPIRLSREETARAVVSLLCLSVWVRTGRRVRRRLGDMCHRHGRRRALILPAQRTVRRVRAGGLLSLIRARWLTSHLLTDSLSGKGVYGGISSTRGKIVLYILETTN